MSVEPDGEDANCICDLCRAVLARYSTVSQDNGGGEAGFMAEQFCFSDRGRRSRHYCPDCMKVLDKAKEADHARNP